MRPKKLIMSAFGPYAQKVEVNLEALGQNGIYLITGDTGAGKTTIFDAITYALYGEASGENRESSMFRSKYADADTPTEVELYFAYAGKEYYVKRTPEYERPKKSGDGTTTEKANAELHYPDGRVVTKLKEVNRAIVEIIGVDSNQFTQIAMIAQGDFLKLLLASTDKRKEIFQKLFKTHSYQVLQEKLRTQSGKLEQEYESLKNSIAQYIRGIVCNEDDVLSIQVKKAKDNQIPMSEIIFLLESLIEEDYEREEAYEIEIKEIEKKNEEITAVLAKAQTLSIAKTSLNQAETALDAAILLRETLAAKLKEEEIRKDEANEIVKKIAAIEVELVDYDDLDNKKLELAKLAKIIEIDKQNSSIKEESLKKLAEGINSLEEELKTLVGTNVDKANVEGTIKELNIKKTAVENIAEEMKNLTKLEQNLAILQDDYKAKASVSGEKKALYEALNKAYLDEQAGILAESLEAGQACPVCGSTEHPCLAQKTKEAPSKETLEKAKKTAEKAQKEEGEASQKAGQAKGTVDEKRTSVQKLKTELLGDRDIEEVTLGIKTELDSLTERLTIIEKNVSRKEEVESLIPKHKENLETAKESILVLGENISKNMALAGVAEKRIQELSQKLMFDSKKAAQEAKGQLELTKNSLEVALKKAKDEFDANENNIVAIKSRIEENKKILSEGIDFDVESEEKAQQELKLKKERLVTLQKQVHSRRMANISSLENIKSKTDEIKTVEEKWMWMKNLSNTANGNLSGKEKIMLETYIQMTYFDRIINRANTRLLVMSGGQYELKRRRKAENNRNKSGLELDVIDHYNGTERSVKTLSGGESFKASLSLALGLSDEIQSSAGGINLDTMFVDEGFGSLDDESLAQAIKALSSLAEGNRLVGIISHVNELKERIDKQIVVTKEKTGGSKITINV